MASAPVATTIVLIDSNIIRLTTGNYKLQWGSLDPQQLPLQRVTILVDETGGKVSIRLPKTELPQSKYVQFYIAITTNSDNEVTIFPARGDTFKGELTQKVIHGYGKVFLVSYLFDSVWFSASSGG